MRKLLLVSLSLLTAPAVMAADPDIEVGPGLISSEFATGHFQNPTAGIQEKGQGTLQYCVGILPNKDNYTVGHGGLAVYGVSEWLEVGAQVSIVATDPDDRNNSYGPQARVRLLENKGLLPELSVGGVFLFDETKRQLLYGVATKRVGLSEEEGFFRSLAGNVGVKEVLLQDTPTGDEEDTVGFFGAEVELPNYLYLIGEVLTKPEGADHVPFSVGVQARNPNGVGFSLAAAQWGNQEKIGVYVGVGINFY